MMRELVDKISHSHVDGKTWVEKLSMQQVVVTNRLSLNLRLMAIIV